jgi:starch synthase
MIVHFTSEVAPFYKRGGLGDVVGALPKYLNERQPNIVLSLYYEGRMNAAYTFSKPEIYDIEIQGILYEFACYHQQYCNIDFYFINMNDIQLFSDMESGVSDSTIEDGEKPYRDNSSYIIYLYFAKAALQLIKNLRIKPDHLFFHDWHVCGCFGFRDMIKNLNPDKPCSTTLLIHNYEHQGEVLPDVNYLLDKEVLAELQPIFNTFGIATLIALGLKNADYVATVSATYAEELMTGNVPHSGLEYFSLIQKKKIYSLPNGVDTTIWSPKTSPYNDFSYNFHTVHEIKALARKGLFDELGLADTGMPVVLMMARLTEQKGINILMDLWDTEAIAMKNIKALLETGIVFIIYGRPSGGVNGDLHKRLSAAEQLFSDQFRYMPNYSDKKAHQLLAACDAILCPSVYEPCGLVQLYGMAFGTVPVVRPVGGLKDTVISYEEDPDNCTGFYIDEFTHPSLIEAMKKTVQVFNNDQITWQKMMKRGMQADYSWEKIRENYYHFFNEVEQDLNHHQLQSAS